MDRVTLPSGIGWVIALIALLLVIVFMVMGQVEYVVGGLIAMVAIARIVP